MLVAQIPPDRHGETSENISDTVQSMLSSLSSTLTFVSPSKTRLPQAPHFLRGTTLHQAWRLYLDERKPFTTAILPADDGPVGRSVPALLHPADFNMLARLS